MEAAVGKTMKKIGTRKFEFPPDPNPGGRLAGVARAAGLSVARAAGLTALAGSLGNPTAVSGLWEAI